MRQPNFFTITPGCTQTTMNGPRALAFDSGANRLFVADANNRVLVYATSTITNGMAATNVLGQPNFTSSAVIATPTSASMSNPRGLAFSANALYVSDKGNNRVLVFDVTTVTDGAGARNVLGQTLFTTSAAGSTAGGLSGPEGLDRDAMNDRLLVSDTGNNRVVIYGGLASMVDGMAATNVLGQSSFATTASAAGATGMFAPNGIVYDGAANRAWVVDRQNWRVLAFTGLAIPSNGQPASDGLGHIEDGVFRPERASEHANKYGLGSPEGLAFDAAGHRLFVCDGLNNRVLVFPLDSSNDLVAPRLPTAVLGQTDYGSRLFARSQSGLSFPTTLLHDEANRRLYVSDSGNRRVLVFDTANVTSGMSASFVIGQPDFTTSLAIVDAKTMSQPGGLALDAARNRLYVGDDFNYRVMVFDVTTLSNGPTAIAVLGQPSVTSSSFPVAPTATNLGAADGIAVDIAANRVFVTDRQQARVLVFDTTTLSTGMAAVHVLGQPNLTSSGSGTSSTSLRAPRGVELDPLRQQLIVCDTGNHRLVYFDLSSPIVDGQAAIDYRGQTSFTWGLAGSGPSNFATPLATAREPASGRTFVLDSGNYRVVEYPR